MPAIDSPHGPPHPPLMRDPSSSQRTLASLISAALQDKPGRSARELTVTLGEEKRAINHVLYSRRDLFYSLGETPPRWYSTLAAPDPLAEREDDESAVEIQRLATGDTDHWIEHHLYPWQQAALVAWEANGHRGIVEAVTGAGKTRVAIAAMAEMLADGGRVAVIVPNVELQRQWRAQVEDWLPSAVIGELGGSKRGSPTLEYSDVLIAVINSAAKYKLGLGRKRGLLVADECHRAAADTFRAALEEEFDWRLGLSATVARPDDQHLSVLLPYFGSVVYELGYVEAAAQQVIAPVRLAHILVNFDSKKQEEYDQLSLEIREYWLELVNRWDVPPEPASEHFKKVAELAQQWPNREGKVAKAYQKRISMRRHLLDHAEDKWATLSALAPSINAADRTMIFTNTIGAAVAAVQRLKQAGISAGAMHAELPPSARRDLLENFGSGAIQVVVAPKVLDEGIDVPAADLGVIMGGSKTLRQMKQRMGRVLRRKDDGRDARFVIIAVQGTVEDPRIGAHEMFLSEVQQIARDEQTFISNRESLLAANRYLLP